MWSWNFMNPTSNYDQVQPTPHNTTKQNYDYYHSYHLYNHHHVHHQITIISSSQRLSSLSLPPSSSQQSSVAWSPCTIPAYWSQDYRMCFLLICSIMRDHIFVFWWSCPLCISEEMLASGGDGRCIWSTKCISY